MADRRLKIIVDQGGNAGAGIDSLVGGLGSLGSVAGGAALAGVGALATATIGLGAAAVSAWSDYDAAVDAIATGTGKTGAALDAMGKSVLNLSTSTAGVNQDMETMGLVMAEAESRTGATGKALEDFTGGILTMSRLTGGDAVTSVEDITRVMGDWGVKMEDSDVLLDKLFKASQASGVGVDELSKSLVQFGAPLRQMGFGIDESIALFAKWEKEGVNSELVMGSLRIAAGHFAKAQGEVNEEVVGGVDSMADAEKKMARLKEQLDLTILKQSEWTDKTKESTKVQSQMKVAELTDQIQELGDAMALGERRTITSASATVSLKDSLMDTFKAIKSAPSDTEALGLAMEVFGARAGPDMAAAIREGRFAIEDMVALIGDSEGALNDAGEATLDFADRFGLIKQKVMNSLIPTGQIIMDLADRALPALENAAGIVSDFFENTFAPGAQKVIDTFDEGGIAGVFDLVKAKWDAVLPVLQAKVGLWMNSLHTAIVQGIPVIGELKNAFTESGLAGVWDLVGQKWTEAAPILQAKLFLMTNTVKTAFAQNWPGIEAELNKWGTNIWNWLGVAATQTDLSLQNFTRTITTWINTHQTDIMEMGSTTGGYIYDGLTASLTDAKKGDETITAFVGSIGGSLAGMTGSLIDLGFTFAAGFLTGIITKWTGAELSDQMMAAVKGALVRTVTGINPLLIFTQTGSSAIDGIIEGIGDGVDRLRDAAVDAARAAFDAAMSWLQAGSPSQLFSDKVGEEAIGGGIAQGVGRAAGAITNATRGALGAAASLPSTATAGAGAGLGGAQINVYLTYAPAVSLGDRNTAQRELLPYILEGIQQAQATRKIKLG